VKLPPTSMLPTSLRLITWNVDFMAPHHAARLSAALSHIQRDVMKCKNPDKAPQPCVVCLQEVYAPVFAVILDNEWVRKWFVVTPTSADKFPHESPYGCVTLVSKSVPVWGACTLEFGENTTTEQGRGALFVDLKMGVPKGGNIMERESQRSSRKGDSDTESDDNGEGEHGGKKGESVMVRIANTHLESLNSGTRMRPVQLGLISNLLYDDSFEAGIVAGDMNAIEPSDSNIHTKLGLTDAWGGHAWEEEGYTWGYQTQDNEHPPGRLDKILFKDSEGYEVDEPLRIGVGVKALAGKDGAVYASDHYGLMTSVRML